MTTTKDAIERLNAVLTSKWVEENVIVRRDDLRLLLEVVGKLQSIVDKQSKQ